MASAVQAWAHERGLRDKASFIVTVDGMYGGYPAIRRARPFLWEKLLGSRDALANIYNVTSTLDARKLFVAVHMRLGKDFDTLQDGENPRGKFNLHIPAVWYMNACGALRDAFGDQVQFYFFTDRRSPAFEEAVRRFNPDQMKQTGLTECSDLALMAQADLRICSVSSYSMMASFLSDGPYIWYEPQLIHESENYTLWGNEPAQRLPGSLTMNALQATSLLSPEQDTEEVFRGWPMGEASPLPHGLIAQLHRRLARKSPAGNLLEFGTVPAWALRT